MITITLLKNHPEHIPALAHIWQEVLGKIWIPDRTIESAIECYTEHLNEKKMPITFIALDGNKPVGMCSLRDNDGIRPDLTPWLGSLVIDQAYQKQGIAPLLIEATKQKAKDLGFDILYLFALDATIPQYYKRLGWQTLALDKYEEHPVVVMAIELITETELTV